MPYATNPVDGTQIYFEDTGGSGTPVVLHGGLLDCVDDVRESAVARGLLAGKFRAVYVDHRGLGRSDKHHEPAAYAMPLRARDPAAVLDELGIDRAHFVGLSWGGRLGFGIGAHTPDRVRTLVCGGQQPHAWPDSPLTRVVTKDSPTAGATPWRWSRRSSASGRCASQRRSVPVGSTTIPTPCRPCGPRSSPRAQ